MTFANGGPLLADVNVNGKSKVEREGGNVMNLLLNRVHLKGPVILLMVLVFTRVEELSANNLYVASGGNDSNPGSLSQPFLTIKKGLSALQAGDTLSIRGGTYKEVIDSKITPIVSGSFSNIVTIQAYNGEPVTIQPPAGHAAVNVEGNIHHTVWKDLILDAIHVRFGLRLTDGAHHNRFVNIEVKNAEHSGMLVSEGTGGTDFNEFIQCRSHNNGSSVLDHGIYLQTSNNLVHGGEYYNNTGFGIHLYGAFPTVNRNVVRQARAHDNGMFGISLTSGDANVVHDNIVCCNARGGIEVNWGTGSTNTSIYNNTISSNGGESIAIGSNNTNVDIRNNVVSMNTVGIVDYGASQKPSEEPTEAEHTQLP